MRKPSGKGGGGEVGRAREVSMGLPHVLINKAGYRATEVACGWAGAIFEVTRPFGQEQGGQSNKIIKKSKV